jgi:hypothetical protein
MSDGADRDPLEDLLILDPTDADAEDFDPTQFAAKFATEFAKFQSKKNQLAQKKAWSSIFANIKAASSEICEWRNKRTGERCPGRERKMRGSRYCRRHTSYENNKARQKEEREGFREYMRQATYQGYDRPSNPMWGETDDTYYDDNFDHDFVDHDEPTESDYRPVVNQTNSAAPSQTAATNSPVAAQSNPTSSDAPSQTPSVQDNAVTSPNTAQLTPMAEDSQHSSQTEQPLRNRSKDKRHVQVAAARNAEGGFSLRNKS